MEYKDPGRYIPIIYLLYSWGSRFGVPSRVPLFKIPSRKLTWKPQKGPMKPTVPLKRGAIGISILVWGSVNPKPLNPTTYPNTKHQIQFLCHEPCSRYLQETVGQYLVITFKG